MAKNTQKVKWTKGKFPCNYPPMLEDPGYDDFLLMDHDEWWHLYAELSIPTIEAYERGWCL